MIFRHCLIVIIILLLVLVNSSEAEDDSRKQQHSSVSQFALQESGNSSFDRSIETGRLRRRGSRIPKNQNSPRSPGKPLKECRYGSGKDRLESFGYSCS